MSILKKFVSPAVVSSIIFHAVLLGCLHYITMKILEEDQELAIESVFLDEEVFEENINPVLEMESEASENENIVSGGRVSPSPGRKSEKLKITQVTSPVPAAQPSLNPSFFDTLPTNNELVEADFSNLESTGETGMVVEGYGVAMSLISQEVLRLMRKEKMMVIWLFDESNSMKDDQKEIKEQFVKIYEELGILQKKKNRKSNESKRRKKSKDNDESLVTAVVSYGKTQHEIVPPTSDVSLIKTGIDKIPIDRSGEEKMCEAITLSLDRYRKQARKGKRKMMVIVVTDESGDNGEAVETTINAAKQTKSVVYFLGREAIFGYPFARIRWINPETNLPYWLRVNRGPETAFPETLQWDGLHARWDVFSSGFGPFEQVRIAKETGGVFYILPQEEENLAGARAIERRQFAFMDMRTYQPTWKSRSEYGRTISGNKFRKTLWDIVVELNPNKHKQLPRYNTDLNIREWHYPLELNAFREEAYKEFVKAGTAMVKLDRVIVALEKIEKLRASEESPRWRANYDLMLAQCLAFRLRLYQYLLAMDRHVNANPPVVPKNPKSNEWNIGRTQKVFVPDNRQFQRLKKVFNIRLKREKYLAMVKKETDRATRMLRKVIQEHPRTPWARRANFELRIGLGMMIYERFWDPRYNEPVALPKL